MVCFAGRDKETKGKKEEQTYEKGEEDTRKHETHPYTRTQIVSDCDTCAYEKMQFARIVGLRNKLWDFFMPVSRRSRIVMVFSIGGWWLNDDKK